MEVGEPPWRMDAKWGRPVEYVGLPEAALNLAHAVVYLATAPKSNRVTVAPDRARADVRDRRGEVPPHLRDAHYAAAKGLGYGEGYEYPHDDPGAGDTCGTSSGSTATSRLSFGKRRAWSATGAGRTSGDCSSSRNPSGGTTLPSTAS